MRRIILFTGIAVFVLGTFWMSATPQKQSSDFVLLPSKVEKGTSVKFIAAGIPSWYDIEKDTGGIFKSLSENNIDGFFLTFQYEEIPKAKSSGQEQLFLDACTSPRAVHTAMENAGVGMVVPLELLYESDRFPNIEDDPLKALIDCVGRSNILAVTNVDEPVHNAVSESFVAALYNRVKTIDATLPVLMVHAPVTADSDEVMNEKQRQEYLQKVIGYSLYADVVGFDVYAIPFELAKITTPYAEGKEVAYNQAIEDYIVWMEENLSDKQHLMAYQAFSIDDQYSVTYRADNIPTEILNLIVPPTKLELQTMVDIARTHSLEYVIWWGQSFIKDNQQLWDDVLSVTKGVE